jgi:hypothetical protein
MLVLKCTYIHTVYILILYLHLQPSTHYTLHTLYKCKHKRFESKQDNLQISYDNLTCLRISSAAKGIDEALAVGTTALAMSAGRIELLLVMDELLNAVPPIHTFKHTYIHTYIRY